MKRWLLFLAGIVLIAAGSLVADRTQTAGGVRVEDIRFEGKGCAISTASASLMTEAIKGKDKSQIGGLFDKVHSLLTKQDAVADSSLGKLAALSGVREYPARVKCASLCWHTLNAALDKGGATVSTE